ncbi:DUF1828 domain-containing protein [Aerococcus sp. UMB8608]|uniref:DUF1828 domain-containing protein n=1 Tax=Aerococcus sanguinicola TaxID=119206 RepID=A0A0X8F9L4_9LACT|nr:MULTISPECIES: DUF1828 domain-containing protein [Aerococcus]AMB93288.1 hypothetical protein AWM72_00130 [Aerococcus sanguinicola]MDK6679387.1 DUF1828 domain-containing protein [Aerococcus sp. UMB8608]MDK6685771.1 DUF1828 domain-containing protein [Aerococcus sp. UMB8623]OFT95920.1 hypothetical protein HMPREF3090_03610 [Aerococcus sp. HMSC23C02]
MNVEDIKKDYLNYIKENTNVNLHKDEVYSVDTPFIDSFGDGISFSIKFDGKLYKITDDGFASWELDLAGINLNKKSKRKELFTNSIDFHGFNLSDNKEIYRKVSQKEIGQAIHDMTQLLINIYDLTYLSRNNVASQFYQDVDAYFSHNDSYAVFPDFNITGKSQLNHRFNYVFLQKGINKLAKVHTRVDKQQVNSILTSWLDTTAVRKNNEKLYVILSNEGYHDITDENLIALESYEISILNFDNKDSLINNLGA